MLSVDDDVHLKNYTESPIDEKKLPETDSYISLSPITDSSALPMNNILHNELCGPLLECPIVERLYPLQI